MYVLNCFSIHLLLLFSSLSEVVEPNVTLRLEGPSSDSSLVCSVHFFYPKHIRVTWLRNGQEVTSDVTSTDVMANGHWSYQIQSYLKYTPTIGERITCMVEHISQTEPKFYDWDPSLPKSEKNKIVIGACGLLLGVVFVAAGLTYRMTSTGWLFGHIGFRDYGTVN
ncbi:H-2 class II histocompatibility antigen, A-S beta chain isoform X2 [Coregonus clupeaformis]|uniref:H-2 class II histocompatibility antigen, A-S beta chain isoform X2 n=1 Tax=Coregonus clupeaformis TaxID=59861 RepID=UPI001E1C2C55|nr:H-2 class II histocompatibility antigen, A-S beta chain isoform X2 [Coregonus clupeaformis]